MAGPAAVNEHSPFKIATRPPKKANARIGLKFGLQFFFPFSVCFFVFCLSLFVVVVVVGRFQVKRIRS